VIHEREQVRRRSFEELKKLVEDMGEQRRSTKTLLKLAIYTNGIKATDAAELIGVKPETVIEWMRVLHDKSLVTVDSLKHQNPTIRPTEHVMEKVIEYQISRQQQVDRSVAEEVKGFDEAAAGADAKAADVPDAKAAEEDEFDLDDGVTYLVFEQKSERSVRLFTREARKGVKGLFITRSNPLQVKKKYFLSDAKVVWLTNVQTDQETESVAGLQELSILVSKFIDESKNGIILFEGVEYLVSNNGFPVVLRLIQQLRDKVSTSASKMLVPVNPDALEERQLSLLESECQTLK